ncbi:MAG: hypothetical protein OEN56_02605 [Gemmatimonadota bacterium]|nr:hypothetical protein [Gemmatimonadota bacterium]
MTFLLFVTAAIVALSGGLKLRSTGRVGLGYAPLALLEMVAAVALALMILPGPFSGTPLERWAVPMAFLLLVTSSIDHALRLRTYRRARADTEGGRLATYVKFLSEMETPPDANESGPSMGEG